METDVSGAHLYLVLWKAWRALAAHDERSIRETMAMCATDFAVLESLLHKGPMPVNTIGRKVLLTSGSITTAVDRLVKRGLVERRADPADRRVSRVHLTRTGRTLIDRAFVRHAAALEVAAGALNRSERTHLIDLLRKLGKAAEAAL